MTQRILGILLTLTYCLGSSVAVTGFAEPYQGILDIGARGTTFAVTADGAVYSSNWGDFGPGLRLNPGEDLDTMAVALEMRDPKKLCIGQWAGFAIDQNDTLWGWGWSVEGAVGDGHAENGPDGPVVILDSVADVQQRGSCTLALCTDGSLWLWGNGWSTRPVKVMDDVAAISDGGLVLTQGGDVWLCQYSHTLPEGVVSDDVFERYVPAVSDDRIVISDKGQFDMEFAPWHQNPTSVYMVLERKLSGVVHVDDSFAFDALGGVWLLDSYAAGPDAVWLCADGKQGDIQAVARERCALVLRQDGALQRFDFDGSGAQTVAENVAQIVRGTRCATYIDQDGQLWRVGDDGSSSLLDSGVLFADGCTDDTVLYIKSDASLWMVKSSGAPQKALEDMKLPE